MADRQLPRISVIVCTYNRLPMLKGNLNSLLTQTLAPDAYEVIVVDNKSTDGTAGYVQSLTAAHAQLRYVWEANQGLSFARNRGIREARGDIVYFIDDDAEAPPHVLQTYLRAFDAHPEVLSVTGRTVQRIDFKVPPWMLNYYKNYIVLGYDQGPKEVYLDKRHGPVGCNMAFRRTVFDQFGMFDTNLGRIGERWFANEEEKLLHALKQRPKSCFYTPDAQIVHIASPSRIGRRYLLRRALDKGISDARSPQSRAQHYLNRPIWRKTLSTAAKIVRDVRESLLFHGLLMSLVYRYAYYREKLRQRRQRNDAPAGVPERARTMEAGKTP